MVERPTRFEKAPESQSVAKKGGGARMEFDTVGIRKFINDRGLDVLWERSWYCTCRHKETLQPDPTCPICLGKGVAYDPAVKTVVAIQSQEKGVSSMDLGLYDSGTAIGTTFINEAISFRDRLTVPDVPVYQSMIFDVTEKRVKNGMYLYYDVKTITMARGQLRGENGVALIEGEDYTIDYSKNIFYPKSHLLNTNVSLNIETVLRYIVTDLLKESRYQYTAKNKGRDNASFEELPRKLLLKREDIFINPEPFSLESNTKEVMKELEQDDLMNSKRRPTSDNTSGFFGRI